MRRLWRFPLVTAETATNGANWPCVAPIGARWWRQLGGGASVDGGANVSDGASVDGGANVSDGASVRGSLVPMLQISFIVCHKTFHWQAHLVAQELIDSCRYMILFKTKTESCSDLLHPAVSYLPAPSCPSTRLVAGFGLLLPLPQAERERGLYS